MQPSTTPIPRNWDITFVQLACEIAKWSKDPNHKVGCIAVDSDRNILATGYNGFPRRVRDSAERLNDKETKRSLIVHAEANCVAAAARNGHSLLGAAIYATRPTCSQCAGLLIQAGVVEIFYIPLPKDYESSWAKSIDLAVMMLTEAGVKMTPVGITVMLAKESRR